MNGLSIILTALIAFVITATNGIWLLPILRSLKYGQTILDIGPSWHKKKQGTPTMGGLMFIIGIVAASIVGLPLNGRNANGGPAYASFEIMEIIFGLLIALAFGMIGFIDDYIKVVKKRNLGLNARQKLVMQFLAAGIFILGLYLVGNRSTIVDVPFLGQWDLGLLYYPLTVCGIVFMVNAVNLTDGLDGLSTSVTLVVSLGFIILSLLLGYGGMTILSSALAGGCLGFLIWNFYPAKVFMGDTGSMFLGGMVSILAFGIRFPIILIFMGIVYIMEAMSVVLQVISFKTTGKRIFKMSPIHHHFEMSGYSEVKIVGLFSFIQLVGCMLSVAAVMQM